MTLLTLTSCLVVIVGAALLLRLVVTLRAAMAPASLRRYRSGAEGAADLLNYAALIDDGIVVGKDGSLLCAWRYRCADMDSSTAAQRDQLSALLNRALAPLGQGWMVHVDAVRQPASAQRSATPLPDPVTEAIEQERRQYFDAQGTAYDGYFVLSVTYLPPLVAQSKFVEMMFDDDRKRPGRHAQSEHIVTAFKRDVAALQARLPLELQRLGAVTTETEHGAVRHDELLRWLHYCITGLSHPIALPKNGAYLDLLIGGQEVWGGTVPRVGRKYVQVVALDGFPMESRPGLLASLAQLPCEYRWSTRFIFLDRHEAVAQLESYRRKWQQKIRGLLDQVLERHTGPVDHDAAAMVDDAEAAIAEVNSGFVAQGYYTSVVVLMDDERQTVERAAEQVYRVVHDIGFSAARVETLNTMEAYLGSLPSHGVQNIRRPLLNSLNLADLLPTSTLWAGSPCAPCPMYPGHAQGSPPLMECLTTGCTPFFLNLHVEDVGHTLMFGPTGAGKSTHLAMIAAQLRRYPGMRIFAFDKRHSLYPLVSAVRAATKGRSGMHFDLGSDGHDDPNSPQFAFAPLSHLETPADCRWAMEWIDLVLGLGGLTTTATQRNEIGRAVVNMQQTDSRSLSDFVMTLQDAEMTAVLQPYTVAGAAGQLLDAEQDSLSLSEFSVFEIGELMGMDDRFSLPVLWYLFRRIERSLDGRPAALLLDEAWILLGHPVMREKIREWLKELRKLNCLVLLATQSLSDASRSGILDVLTESCPTKIFLPNPDARQPDAAKLYQGMGLNSRQIEIIATAVPRRQYYYVSPKGRRLYELALGPTALALCAASGIDQLEAIRKLQALWGDQWVPRWLASQGAAALECSDEEQAA